MGTNLLRDISATDYLDDQQTYGAATVTSSDVDTAVTVAVIPEGCYILFPVSGAGVTTAFNAATTNTIEFSDGTTTLGTTDTSALGFVPWATAATAAYRTTAETTITATVKQTGGSLTAGKAEVIVQWVRIPT